MAWHVRSLTRVADSLYLEYLFLYTFRSVEAFTPILCRCNVPSKPNDSFFRLLSRKSLAKLACYLAFVSEFSYFWNCQNADPTIMTILLNLDSPL